MNTEELAAFHDNLADVLARDGEEAASDYLSHHMGRLPDEVRKEILARIFFDEMVKEAGEIEAIAAAQRDSIAAAEALQILKKELNKATKTSSES